MQATDDSALLREYAANNSGEAFAALVARHINLVYSVAFRQAGQAHEAQEITQAVFIILARKAGQLRHDQALASWLFQTTRLTANNFLRSELRRLHREQEAFMQSTLNESGNEVWPAIAPLLDTAVAGLGEKDRRAILLRFYEGRNMLEVGAALGASEEAAKKRVNRAVEKLRAFFTKRGVAVPAAALTAAISANSVAAAPVELAKTVTAFALAKGVAGGTVSWLATAAKGGASAKAAGALGLFGAILWPVLAFLNLFGAWRFSHQGARSDRERRIYKIYYPVLAGSIMTFIFLTSWLMSHGGALVKTNPSRFASLMTGLILGYFLLLAPLCLWFFHAVKKSRLDLPVMEDMTRPKGFHWEYRSRFQWFGLPFVHIRFGGFQPGRPMQSPVKAWIAITDSIAFGGLFAYGGVAIAPVSLGACAIGLFSYGAMAIGALVVGGFAFGVWAFGAFGLGWQASAGCAIAWNIASGAQFAIAHQYALGPIAHAAQANTDFVRHLVKSNLFFQVCWKIVPYFIWLMWLWGIPLMISQWWALVNRRRRQTAKTI